MKTATFANRFYFVLAVLPFSRKFPFLRKFYCRKGKSKEEKKSKEIEGFFPNNLNIHPSALVQKKVSLFLEFFSELSIMFN
jgi:hypothetical protein